MGARNGPVAAPEEMPQLSIAAMSAPEPTGRRTDDAERRVDEAAGETGRAYSTLTPTTLSKMPQNELRAGAHLSFDAESATEEAVARSRRLSESETEESAALLTTPSPRLSPRARPRKPATELPVPKRSKRWAIVAVFVITLLAALGFILG